jgi:predicted nucleic acid-binding protein
VTAFIDTNVLVRHLTGDPPDMAARATAYLQAETELLLADLVAAETVYVLESFYEAPRYEIAQAIRSRCCGPSKRTRPSGWTSPRPTSSRAQRAPA